MSTIDLLNTWATLSTDEIAMRLAAGRDLRDAAQLFGAEGAEALAAAAPQKAQRRVDGPREPVVLIPGVMGSQLASIRGITTLLWLNPALLLRGQVNYLELDDLARADRYPAIEALPTGLDKLCYLKLALLLRGEAELYEFPYDWRRSILYNADVLAKALERWAAGTGQRFTLVGHSMGGLVARAYLAQHPRAAARRVRRVVSLGTPYFGTVEAVENFVRGNTLMKIATRLNPANDVDRVLLGMPSLYELLPAPHDLLPGPSQAEPPVNWNVYSKEAWRLTGLRERHLAGGERFHRLLASADPQVETVQVAGCNVETTTALHRSYTEDEEPIFTTVRYAEGRDSGDGPVPLWSAVHPKVQTYYVEEQHRYLPANATVQAALLDLLYGGKVALPTTVPGKHRWWAPREVTPPDPRVAAEALRMRIETGAASEADLAQLYFAL